MNIKNIIIAAAILACSPLGLSAQTITKLTSSKANDYGLIYSLPITALDITIETEYVECTPGEFYNFAKRNLNVNNAITEPSITARIKSIVITPRGEADPDNRWLVDFKGGSIVNIILDENNVPIAINTEDAPEKYEPELPWAMLAEATVLETSAAQYAMTQDMIMSSSISKKAQLTAERIFELRDQRNDLISGQAENTPPDGHSMQLALDNLSSQEAALTAMFVGTEKRWTDVNTLIYVPDEEPVKNFILARLSPTDGIVDSSDLTGTPIYLSVDILEKGEIPVDEKGQPKPFPKNGVAYQVPGTALITIDYDGANVCSQQVSLAQLGVTYGLDPKIFSDKKAPGYLKLDSATGAIISLGVTQQ